MLHTVNIMQLIPCWSRYAEQKPPSYLSESYLRLHDSCFNVNDILALRTNRTVLFLLLLVLLQLEMLQRFILADNDFTHIAVVAER